MSWLSNWYHSRGGDQNACLWSILSLPVGAVIGGIWAGGLGVFLGLVAGTVVILAVLFIVEKIYAEEYRKMNIRG